MAPGRASQESATHVRNGGRSRCIVHSSSSSAFASAALPFAVVSKVLRSGPAAGSSDSEARIIPARANFLRARAVLLGLSALLSALRVSALSFLFILLPLLSLPQGHPESLTLYFITSLFPLIAPPPPLALLRIQPWIPRLRHRRAKHVQHADILMLPRHAPQFLVQLPRVLPGQLRHAANPQQLEVPQHGGSNRNQIGELTGSFGHKNLLDLPFCILYPD